MFHSGDLQSGIAQALTESKLVACFVRGKLFLLDERIAGNNLRVSDDSNESALWENDFLRDQDVYSCAPSIRDNLWS